jgi:hypothetical protein
MIIYAHARLKDKSSVLNLNVSWRRVYVIKCVDHTTQWSIPVMKNEYEMM